MRPRAILCLKGTAQGCFQYANVPPSESNRVLFLDRSQPHAVLYLVGNWQGRFAEMEQVNLIKRKLERENVWKEHQPRPGDKS